MTPCITCPEGHYSPPGSVGNCSLFVCPEGTVDDDQASSTPCLACATGTFANTTTCEPCTDPLTDHDLDAATSCEPCGAGLVRPFDGVGPCFAASEQDSGSDGTSLGSTTVLAAIAAIGVILLIVAVVIVRQRRHLRKVSREHAERMDKLRDEVKDLFCTEFLTGTSKQQALKKYSRLEVARPDVDILTSKKLGSGAFGTVYLGNYQGRKVAIKTLSAEHGDDDTLQKGFLYETRLMALVNHPRIVNILGVVTFSTPLLAILEFMEGGDLHSQLRKLGSHLLLGEALGVCVQVAEGLDYLSTLGVVHRDLAARNVLVGDSLANVKLVRLGSLLWGY